MRTFVAAVVLALAAAPVLAQDAPADPGAVEAKADVVAFAQPSNAERLEVLKTQLTEAGLPFEVQTFEGGGDRTGPLPGSNVVVTLGEGDKDLLLVAHYDAARLRDGTLSQGLVDNAAGVVALIEAGALIKDQLDQGGRLNHRVLILFTDQEELGLIGARRWIEAHGLDRVAAVVNTDVGAWGDTVMYGLNNGEQSRLLVRTLREQCIESAIQCIAYPQYPPSDDRAFSAAGAPVVSIGWQDEVGAHDMWLAFNDPEAGPPDPADLPLVFQRIHSAEDKAEHVDGATVARAGLFHADLILRLDRTLGE